ncbi:hypothetical protein M8C21_028759 [Ambrosia artemisiifolia]|uniref:Uncharacterized protein n=1 Tax=Ambrosia artemisiifolia TaxID=4212 RepID=A0AAD5C9I2_AMBAR|nr:hypothetical protein M8C21_028759 [Ambrosia artemisiifolia]
MIHPPPLPLVTRQFHHITTADVSSIWVQGSGSIPPINSLLCTICDGNHHCTSVFNGQFHHHRRSVAPGFRLHPTGQQLVMFWVDFERDDDDS